ncbi:MAG: nucleotidyl transferase AbiEii/AbiGii toxin family protein [Saprospiraceae bacterium]|nr:nucleotidyl transferase AbiEii/AbiGii toxin family protein [Saprospiraceae bacterium]
MINIEQILSYFPDYLQKTKKVHLIREYLQFMMLNYLSNSKFAKELCFIGGTNLRLIHGIDRFSEDLDFDNKNLSKVKFIKMTDSLIKHLQNTGLKVVADDKSKDDKLMAYRRNLVFPQFLYDNGLSPFKDAKFLIKIESQDQGVDYKADIALLNAYGFVFNFPVPANDVLCSMKIAALLNRKKGRDFYDVMFMLSKTQPNYNFLKVRTGISTPKELKEILIQTAKSIDLKHKSKDFEHLIIDSNSSKKILLFPDFISQTIDD